ncbi:MAG TPA: hypothetical protein VFD06_12760, partial [Candidatus Polarisedimenticolia bacterium]|nr:hypothetical protein [Candidatus Polarisedimenticolia bacterium]
CQADGRCGGSPRVCTDPYDCTIDGCDPAHGCTFVTDCDDGSECTSDFCGSSGCGHLPIGGHCFPTNRCIDDGLSHWSCIDNHLVCTGPPRICNDDTPCTIDSCDPGRGCVYQPVSCDDGNPCTFDLPCQFMTGCYPDHPFQPGPCDDNDPCTTSDTCVPPDLNHFRAYCRGTSSCDDGNPCTDDICDAAAPGGCRHVNNTDACSDGVTCTRGDLCVEGTCRPGEPRSADCNDGDFCSDDVCDPIRGCVSTPRCDDGNPCTGNGCTQTACFFTPISGPACGDACVIGGVCVNGGCVGTPVSCDDSSACTTDACDPQSGCRNDPIDCNDGNVCTLDECDPANGCRHLPALDCDDGNACTLDACDALSGCQSRFDPALPDLDGDGVPDLCDGCPAVPNADQADGDGDGVGDACDVCPTLPDPGQDPSICVQQVTDLTLELGTGGPGKGAGLVSWRTTHEVSLAGFDIVSIDARGRRTLLTPVRVPCTACATGEGAGYSVLVQKHRSSRDVYVEMIGSDGGLLGRFGPAIRR